MNRVNSVQGLVQRTSNIYVYVRMMKKPEMKPFDWAVNVLGNGIETTKKLFYGKYMMRVKLKRKKSGMWMILIRAFQT